MAYYLRILSTSADPVPVGRLRKALTTTNPHALLEILEGDEATWEHISIVAGQSKKSPIMMIERPLVTPGSLGQEELDEFAESVPLAKPESAARWLLAFFTHVKTVYAMQILTEGMTDSGWQIIDAMRTVLWEHAEGIMQADDEGFSNPAGYHILWEFADNVTGPWYMALLRPDGTWANFQMDLGNRAQREAFLRGLVPPDVTLLTS
jgi:hypothetical protein